MTTATAGTVVPLAPARDASVRVARTVEDVEAIRSAWERVAPRHPDADIDFFLDVVRDRPEVIRPHVLLLDDDGAGEPALLVARVEERALPARFGYATLWRPGLRCLTVVSGGLTGSERGQERLVTSLLETLGEGDVDALFLHKAVVGSQLHTAATERVGVLRRTRPVVATRHWARELPGSYDEFQKSLPKQLRGNVRRDGRKLVEALGDRLRIDRLNRPEHLERILADLEQVAAKTYQRGLGAGFDAGNDAELVRLGLERGWFNAWVLYVDDGPCAFEIGDVYRGTFFSAAKGFDPDLGRLNVGTFLQMRMFEDLCADPAVERFDFGYGDADYKRRCATQSWEESDLVVYAAAPRPLLVNAVRTAVATADALARRVGGKDRIAWVKRRWRDLRTPARG
jgi:CelD/BcsL family acetyltransferase involved in cellulose biosynthesis